MGIMLGIMGANIYNSLCNKTMSVWILNSLLTHLFLSCNQVPVVHEPRLELLWDFHFNLHSIYESLLLIT